MQSFSEHITNVLFNSWRPATQKQYTVYIKKWAIVCGARKIALFSPDLSNVSEFLYTLLNLSYSSLNTARSTLSCIVMIEKNSCRPTPSCLSFPQKGPLNKNPLLINIMAFGMLTKCCSF